MREFSEEGDRGFSSFAHFIGLIRGLDLALSGRQPLVNDPPSLICSRSDTCITAWCSLLPENKKSLIQEDGTVDGQLFRANMLIHT